MISGLSIQKKLYVGFFAIVSIIIVLLLSSYKNFLSLNEASALDRHTLQVLIEGDGLDGALLDVQADFRGFLLTGNERFLEKTTAKEAELKRHIDAATRLTTDSPVQQERMKTLDVIVTGWQNRIVRPLIAKRRELGKVANAADIISRDPLLISGFDAVNEVRDVLGKFTAEENRLLTERAKRAASLNENMLLLLLVGGIVCVAMAAVIAFLLARAILLPLGNLTSTVNQIADGNESARADVISKDELGKVTTEVNRMAQTIQDNQRRERETTDQLRAKVDALLIVVSKAAAGDLTGKVTVNGNDAIGQLGEGLSVMFENLRGLLNKIQKAGIQVTTSTTEIAASAKQQEATGVEQAQTSVEVLSTTREISANTVQLLKTMGEATQVAEFTTNATADAQINLARMDQTMQHMVGATDSINAKLAALSEKASNINSVLTTITKVADQTNILSLNAAIEAEKAGDAGRGFSVVATEIRRLADQTSVATWDIEQMLKEMQSAVAASVMGMDKFSEEIRRSVGEVRMVGEQLSTVIEQVRQLPPRFDAVLEGMQSQSVGASQITETMMQLSDASQQTVESLKATSEAVHQLQYAARDLQTSVQNFAVNS